MIRIKFEKEIADILERIISKRETIYQGNICLTANWDTIRYSVYISELESNYVVIKKESFREYTITFRKDLRRYNEDLKFIEENLSVAEINDLLTKLVLKLDSIVTAYHKGDEKRARKERKRQKKEAMAFIKSLFK